MSLLKSRDHFWAALQRIHSTNSGVTYTNEDDTFKLMIRNDPEGGAGKYMVMDLVIVAPEEEERVVNALEMENDGWWDDDDPSSFIVESWEFDKKTPDEDELKEMMEYVNATYAYKICPCAKYFIKDQKEMCFYCELTASEDGIKKATCPICLSDGYMMHMKTTTCCSQIVHHDCARTWSVKGKTGTCALCRAPTKEPMSVSDRIVLDIDQTMIEDIVQRITASAARLAGDDTSDTDDSGDSENVQGNTE
jgi:hypothetical protein